MLSELVIAKKSEQKESLTKREVSEILKFGAEELFKDDDVGKVVYTDEDLEKILDRDLSTESTQQDNKFGLNEYLRSFKVHQWLQSL